MDTSKTRKCDHFNNINTFFGSPLSRDYWTISLFTRKSTAGGGLGKLSGWHLNLSVFLSYVATACFLVKVSISLSFHNKLEEPL